MPRKKKRAQRGQGTFRMKPSGSIEYRFTYTDPYGNSCRKSVSGATRQECLDKADEFLSNQRETRTSLDENISIVDILKAKHKMDFKLNYLSEAGFGRNIESIKILEKSPIGKVPIRNVKKQHIEQFSGTITHYSNSTIEKIFLQLKIAFEIALDEGVISKNPMLSKTLRRPKSVKADKKVRALTPEEQKIFVDAMENRTPPKGRNDYRLQLYIELYSGMRMGEINALTIDSIDLVNNVIHVTSTISKGVGNNWFVKVGTKTDAGVRDIPINNTLRPYLEEALRRYKRNRQKLIFYDHTSKSVITTSQVNSYYKRVCESVGIETTGQNSLRHTFTTRCIEAGIPPVVLKTWLGHTDIHITLDTYTDVFDSMDKDAIDKLDEYLENENL